MRLKIKVLVELALLLSSMATCLTQAQTNSPAKLAVVVNVNNPASNLSTEVVGDLYLHRATHFPNANEVSLIDQPVNSPMYEVFYRELTHKTPGQIQGYWSRLVFTGKGRPPKQVAGSTEVKRIVSGNNNSIGYVDEATLDKTVKPILILAK